MAYPVQFICRGLRIIGLVLLYYVFSIGITFYNKWLMTVSEERSPQEHHDSWVGLSSSTVSPWPGLPLSPLHDAGPHRHDLLAVGADEMRPALVDGQTSRGPELEGLPHQSSSHRWGS